MDKKQIVELWFQGLLTIDEVLRHLETGLTGATISNAEWEAVRTYLNAANRWGVENPIVLMIESAMYATLTNTPKP